jgi:hypothetical protein
MTFIPSAHAPASAFTTKYGIPDGATKKVWVPAWKPRSSVGWHGHWTDDRVYGEERSYPGTGKHQYVNGGGNKQNHTNVPDSNGNYISDPRYVRTDGADTPSHLEDQQPHGTYIQENVFKKDTIQVGNYGGETLDVAYIDAALAEAIRTGQAAYDQERVSKGESTSKELTSNDGHGFGIQAVPQAWKSHYLTVKYDRPAGLLKLA